MSTYEHAFGFLARSFHAKAGSDYIVRERPAHGVEIHSGRIVNTVSIVCVREPSSWPGTDHRRSSPAVPAAGDGIGAAAAPDDPVSGAPLAAESHFDARRAQKGLRATQPRSKRSWTSGPLCAPQRTAIADKSGGGTEKVRGRSRPRPELGHDLARAGGHSILSMTFSTAALRFAS